MDLLGINSAGVDLAGMVLAGMDLGGMNSPGSGGQNLGIYSAAGGRIEGEDEIAHCNE